MTKIDYRDPDSLPTDQRLAYNTLVSVFTALAKFGWGPMEVNAFVIGMCRSSMEDLLGKEGAIAEDLAWRKGVGWTNDEAKAANADLLKALEEISQIQRDKCENASAEMLFMVLDNKVDIALAALTKAKGSTSMEDVGT